MSGVDARAEPSSDAQWHRMHPLTPLLRGGVFVIVAIGVIISNLRERILFFLFPWLLEEFNYDAFSDDDLLSFIVINELYFVGLLVLLLVALLVVLFAWFAWRRRSYRITDEQVELRQGVIFRSQRRAPLDRIQNVTLVRPFVARMFGLSKLMIAGAGADTTFELSYLNTAVAERLRAEILLLASGQRPGIGGVENAWSVGAPAAAAPSVTSRLLENIDGIVHGEDQPRADDAATIRVKASKLVLASLLDTSSLIIGALLIGAVVLTIFWPWSSVSAFLPLSMIIAFAGIYWATTISPIFKSLRFSLTPSRDGVQITSGLTTTTSDFIPPGRVQSIELSQAIVWRALGFWRVKATRFTSGDASERERSSLLLPLGDLDTALAAVEMLWSTAAGGSDGLADDDPHSWNSVAGLLRGGALGPVVGDGFTRAPRRSGLLSPFAWKLSAFTLRGNFVAFRTGFIARRVIVVMLQRAQGTAVKQGIVPRKLRLGTVEVSLPNSFWSPAVYWVDIDDARELYHQLSSRIKVAMNNDRSHRWADRRLSTALNAGVEHPVLNDEEITVIGEVQENGSINNERE